MYKFYTRNKSRIKYRPVHDDTLKLHDASSMRWHTGDILIEI